MGSVGLELLRRAEHLHWVKAGGVGVVAVRLRSAEQSLCRPVQSQSHLHRQTAR